MSRRFWRESFIGGTLVSLLNSQEAASRLVLIAATRLTQTEFEKKSLLGKNLARIKLANSRLTSRIFYSNTRGLSSLYNTAIDELNDDDIVVFLHDDVWLGDTNFAEKLIVALKKFDVVGVAGNTKRQPNQPAWLFREMTPRGDFIWDEGSLSGSVRHGNSDESPLSIYGAAPAQCELLDGLFLAAKIKTLKRSKVRFDERFAFHFYDLDFCRTARRAGLRLGTWPLNITHQSAGSFGGEEWRGAYDGYLKKWKN